MAVTGIGIGLKGIAHWIAENGEDPTAEQFEQLKDICILHGMNDARQKVHHMMAKYELSKQEAARWEQKRIVKMLKSVAHRAKDSQSSKSTSSNPGPVVKAKAKPTAKAQPTATAYSLDDIQNIDSLVKHIRKMNVIKINID